VRSVVRLPSSLPARGRPPEAAARRAGLEFVERLLPRWGLVPRYLGLVLRVLSG
jgi:hypothetical protein